MWFGHRDSAALPGCSCSEPAKFDSYPGTRWQLLRDYPAGKQTCSFGWKALARIPCSLNNSGLPEPSGLGCRLFADLLVYTNRSWLPYLSISLWECNIISPRGFD